MTELKPAKKTNSAIRTGKGTKPQATAEPSNVQLDATELSSEQLEKVNGGIIAILIGMKN